MSHYMLSMHYPTEPENVPPPEDLAPVMEGLARLTEEMQAQGAWVFGNGLHPASTATVVRVESGDVTTTDGPYLETKEHLGGFWVIEAADLDEALALAAEGSRACRGPVEVRPFHTAESVQALLGS
jgi:hypothetical protein